jgi:peptide chain release factor 1
VLALEDLGESADGLGDRHVDARRSCELFGHVERLGEEALDAPRPVHGELVLVGELVDAEDGDDVLELLVALERLLDLVGHREVLLPHDVGLEDRGGRVQRVDRRVDALLRDGPRERRRRVEVGEHRRRGGVGEVVSRHVDGLDRRDRPLAGRGDPLLELAHLGLQRRLVAHLRRHAAEQRRDLRARLDEAEDVVDEQEDVLALLVAEVLRHRQAGQRDAHAGAGRLVHLPEHEHRLVDDARLLHLEPQVVALAGALAHAAEGRQTAVLLRQVVDQLLDQDGLPDAGAAEQAHLAALGVGREEIHYLDAGLEHLRGRDQVLDVGRRAVDRPARVELDIAGEVDRLAEEVEDAAQRAAADRHGDRSARIHDLRAA